MVFFVVAWIGVVQSQSALSEINTDVWQLFSKAYETSDAELFASFHADDMIRISGNSQRIKSREEYLEGMKRSFEGRLERKERTKISFRFTERFIDKDKASEKGIYKLFIVDQEDKNRSYYGTFHVLHRKEDGHWKIFLDYDVNKNNEVGEADFLNASHLDDL